MFEAESSLGIVGRGLVPRQGKRCLSLARRARACPSPCQSLGARDEQDLHDFHDLQERSRVFKICKSHVCSSGSPDPERRKRKTLPGTVARGPVPRDRSTCAKTERQPSRFPFRSMHSVGPRPTERKTRAPRKTPLQVRRTCMSIVTRRQKKPKGL